ncbi:MAG TPA: autotransporter domain-containing protein [Hyphomicrobium sp.]|nr:autotransporter domain-containing protein [Hyphomicrobium sp.]
MHVSLPFRSAVADRQPPLNAAATTIYYFDVVHDYPSIGGIVEFSQILFRQLKARYGARLISAREAATRLGAPDASQMAYIDRERHIAELLAKTDPSSVFFFPNFQSPVARDPAASGPRIINVVHDVQFDALPELFSAGRLRWLERAFANTGDRADQVVFISEAARQHYVRRFGTPRRHTVIYNPIEIDPTATSAFDDGAPFLLSSFHHYPHKNFSGLLSLFASLAERDPQLKLVVTGHGGEKFQRDLANLPEAVQARVRHLGYVPRRELDGLYRRARAFLTLSRFEGFNMSAAEAACHGTPLILSDLPVHRELFSDRACFVDPLVPDAGAVSRYLAERTHQGAPWRLSALCDPARAASSYAEAIDAACRALDSETLMRDAEHAVRTHRPKLPGVEAMARALLTTTMLVGAMGLSAQMLSHAAFADGGHGGGQIGRFGDAEIGVPGGSGYMGADGDDGAAGSAYFGGGGGGAGGGTGGLGDIYNCPISLCSIPGTGGAGGTALNPDGEDGGTANYAGGGGGGGGGFHGNGFTGLFGGTDLTGGDGGAGGTGTTSGPGAAGGGGAGGFGALITGGGSFDNAALSITGGKGGAGGLSPGYRFLGGNGGDGGVGIYFSDPGASFTSSGAIAGGHGGDGGGALGTTAIGGAGGAGGVGIFGNDVALTINGTVRGGDGGAPGDGPNGFPGEAGAGGAGIVGSDLTIVTSGSISGGLSGDGVRADALTFTGGANTLTFQNATSGLTGGITVHGLGTTLTFNQDNGVDVVIDNDVSGDGSIIKDGANLVVLSGNNTFSGSMTILAGTLVISGTLSGTTYFEDGAVLKGTGTMSNVTIRSGGIHAPGNSIGTQTILGAYVLGPGAILEIETNAAGQSDKVVVLGTVDLTGSILRVLADNGSYAARTSYVIIDNDGNDAIAGAFADITSNLAFLTPTVTYTGGDGNDVVLTLARNTLRFADVAETRNQAAVAGMLDQRGGSDAITDSIAGLDADGARRAFDALSGEVHASIAGVLVQDSRYLRNILFSRMGQASPNAPGSSSSGGSQLVASGASGQMAVAAASPPPGRMALGARHRDDAATARLHAGPVYWAQGYGAWGDDDSDGNAAGIDRSVGGFVSGMDVALASGWRAGLAAGYAHTNLSVGARASSADIESYHLAGYASGWIGGFALRTGASWSWHDIDTERAIVLPGFADRLDGSYDGDTGQIFGEIARPFVSGALAFEPFAGLAWVHAGTESFAERGGLAALAVRSGNLDTGYSTLGLRAATRIDADGLSFVPRLSLAWQHAFGDVTPVTGLAFASGGAGISIAGVPIARDSALIEAGLDISSGPDTTFGISYHGRISDDADDHGLSGRVQWRF